MKYKIVILLILAVFLGFLIDRAFVKYAPLPCDNNASNPANPTCAENNNDDKAEDDANIAYKTFSSPKADFTFEYPSTWVYEEKPDAYDPSATGWSFYTSEKEKFEMPILAVISPLTEIVDFCSVGYKGTKNPYQLNTFSTNDPETFVTYEQCGGEYGGAYIYWQKGEYFANASLINDIHKINLMNFYSGSEKEITISRHIAESIKIK